MTKITKTTKKGGNPKKPTARKPKGLWEKIFLAQQDVKTVIKLGFNDFQKYKYARESDIINEIKPVLNKYGLLITTSLLSEEYDREAGIAKVIMKFTIRDYESGEADTAVFPGTGQDISKTGKPGDKAIPKALTMATKYFLSKYFLLETNDDAEADTSQDKRNAKPAKTEQTSPQELFNKAKQMIKTSNNVNGLIEWYGKIDNKKIYTKAQKDELKALINSRVDELNKINEK